MGEGRRERRQEGNGTAPIKVKKDEKDKDNIESACKERSFPGRLASIF